MTVQSCRNCQLRRAVDICRERRKSSPLLLSWAGLLGHKEFIQVAGQQRDSCAHEQLLCTKQKGWGRDLQETGTRVGRELTGCVECGQAVSSLNKHCSQSLRR